MAEQQFIMTQKGYDEAVERLKYLQTVKRQEIVERIAEARSHGDLSENAEYDAARNEQAANEGEIVDLDYKIKNAVILEANSDTSYVHIGSKVTVYDEVEKTIKKDKPSRLHARREMLKVLYPVVEGEKRKAKEVDLVEKLFTEIAPKYENRNGGYTRIVKIGLRKGDAAMEVLLELV